MIAASYAVFFAGVVAHVVAAVAALAYLTTLNNRRLLAFASRLTLAGALLFSVLLVLRGLTWSQPPLTTAFDVLTLFLTIISGTVFFIALDERRRALLAFYLPAVALLCMLAIPLAIQHVPQQPPVRDLSRVLLVVHVVLAFLAYALFFVASLTSMTYAYLSRRLKQHRASLLVQHKLPSLENLDRTLYRLIGAGYPLFVVTLVLGLGWAWYNPNPLSSTWWLSPKILLSVVMVIFYALSFHGRAAGWLRGPKLAYFVFVGFGSLLLVYLLLGALGMKDYNFWGAGQ